MRSQPVRILKEGYWDRTSVVPSEDGCLRVRKESKDTASPGPWAHQALRNEIAYLASLPQAARAYFPPLLDSWDELSIGYEIPFFAERQDVARLSLAGKLSAEDAESIQAELSRAVLSGLHAERENQATAFATHLETVLEESIIELAGMPPFRDLVESPSVSINGAAPIPGLHTALDAVRQSGVLTLLATQPSVRLHGDLILENILWPGLVLIDPVSVTGLTHGPPLFDLVKYESYASGELYAIREELVTAEPAHAGGYSYEIFWSATELAAFTQLDLRSRFRAEFVHVHGPVHPQLYHLLDAYFSLVMARNTTGRHQFARVLKGSQCLAASSAGPTS